MNKKQVLVGTVELLKHWHTVIYYMNMVATYQKNKTSTSLSEARDTFYYSLLFSHTST